MQLSNQQKDVIQWAKEDSGSLNLVARAGCGKTTTLMELVFYIVDHNLGDVFIGAYNKAIADELSARLKKHDIDWRAAYAGTLHSAGFSAWRRVAQVKVDGDKVDNILQDRMVEADYKLYAAFVRKAVSLAKQRAFGVLCDWKDTEEWKKLVEHFGLDDMLPDAHPPSDKWDQPDHLKRAIEISIKTFRASVAQDYEIIDFDDMILAPLIHDARVYPKDWVLIDEAQDTNPARRALAMKMLKPRTGRLVAVGDPAQAIYGFTGADADALNQLVTQLNSKELPLNVTYRCPKSIVRLAQTWVADITAHESAPEGTLRTIALDEQGTQEGSDGVMDTFWNEKLTKNDVILCRNTAPLVELAYRLIRRGTPCKIEGRDIARGLVKLIRRWKIKRLNTLRDRLASYSEREIQKWLAKGKEERAAQVEDQVATLNILITNAEVQNIHDIDGLVAYVEGMFGDQEKDPDVLTLCTVHRSKGREWPRVYLLGRNSYMPSKWARKPWQVEQEDNLCYVAVTRAMNELVEILV